jgi:hypothetical protein
VWAVVLLIHSEMNPISQSQNAVSHSPCSVPGPAIGVSECPCASPRNNFAFSGRLNFVVTMRNFRRVVTACGFILRVTGSPPRDERELHKNHKRDSSVLTRAKGLLDI